ncbi:hypothetical protein BJ170DRAFT_698714 [Xylariales sp. AK1849]|nr:hypothetical protein BJ170DRAFT_698714 [Xylariales sp. AK1849]
MMQTQSQSMLALESLLVLSSRQNDNDGRIVFAGSSRRSTARYPSRSVQVLPYLRGATSATSIADTHDEAYLSVAVILAYYGIGVTKAVVSSHVLVDVSTRQLTVPYNFYFNDKKVNMLKRSDVRRFLQAVVGESTEFDRRCMLVKAGELPAILQTNIDQNKIDSVTGLVSHDFPQLLDDIVGLLTWDLDVLGRDDPPYPKGQGSARHGDVVQSAWLVRLQGG